MIKNQLKHPVDSFLNHKKLPSTWCAGCGIGITLNNLIRRITSVEIDIKKIWILSGQGCSADIPDYLKFNSLKCSTGNLINKGIEIKSKDPDNTVIIFTNNIDFLISAARDIVRAGEAGIPLLLIHINNLVCYLTEKEIKFMTPFMRYSYDRKFELPFNLPLLVRTAGATYIARWTPLRAGWLRFSLNEALENKGFSFIELINLCVLYIGAQARIANSVQIIEFYENYSTMKEQIHFEDLDLRIGKKIIIGKFLGGV